MPKIRQLPADWVKLNLGCNQNLLDGWTNVDVYPFDGVDMVMDLEKDWQWEDNSVHYIRAYDIFEHLHDSIHTMNEAWRVLGHGGMLELWVPSTDGRGAFQDPTHVSFWNRNSLFYYSKKFQGSLYPGLIKCDFDISTFDTKKDESGVIWTWGLCRAIKDKNAQPVVPAIWHEALGSLDPSKREVPGYQGTSLGTIPQESPDE